LGKNSLPGERKRGAQPELRKLTECVGTGPHIKKGGFKQDQEPFENKIRNLAGPEKRSEKKGRNWGAVHAYERSCAITERMAQRRSGRTMTRIYLLPALRGEGTTGRGGIGCLTI